MDWSPLFTWVGRMLIGGGSLAGVALGLLFWFQEKLIYVPRLPGIPNEFPWYPDSFGLVYEDVEMTAEDGTRLHGWFMYPKQWRERGRQVEADALRTRPTVLFFQENAGNMAMRLPFIRLFVMHLDCSFFAPSYRGYGLSKGIPTEKGLQQDARAALDHLLSRRDINPAKLVLMGRSLGGAVAIHLAAQRADRFAGIIIENTFTSLEELAPKVMPFLSPFLGLNRPANALLRNKWRNNVELPKVGRKPILLLCSLQDEMVPATQMRELYGILLAAQAPRVTWTEFPNAHHMTAYEEARHEYWPAIITFVNSVAP